MRFRCESCGAHYAIAEEKLGKKGVRIRCKKCGEIITVRPSESEEESEGERGDVGSQPNEQGGQQQPGTDVQEPGAVAAQGAFEDEQQWRGEAAGSEGFDLGEDPELSNALNDILGDQDAEGDDEGFEAGRSDPDGQATRVFNVEQMQQIQAEREQAARDAAHPGARATGLDAPSGYGREGSLPSDLDREKVEWYAAVEERQIGPMSLAEFATRWESGELGTDTLVWKTGFDDWLSVFEVPQLAFLAEERQAPAQEPSDWASETEAQQPDWDGSGRSLFEEKEDAWDRDELEADEGDDSYGEEQEASSDSTEAFVGGDVDWKPSALSSLESLAEEELATLRPEDPKAESEDRPFGEQTGQDEEGLGEEMDDGDSSLIAQIAAEEEAVARRVEQQRREDERQAEQLRLREEESTLEAQEAASREKLEEQRKRVAPPEERYIPPRSSLPKWAIGLMVGGGFLVLALLGFLGFMLWKLTTSQELSPTRVAQPLPTPTSGRGSAQSKDPAPVVAAVDSTAARSDARAGALAGKQKVVRQPERTKGQPGARPSAPGSEAKPSADATPSRRTAKAKPEQKRPPPNPKRKPGKKETRAARVAAVRAPPAERPAVRAPAEQKRPTRKKSAGGILDFEDPDDRAFAAEAGIKPKVASAPEVEKKKAFPPLTNADVLAVMKRHIEEFRACNRAQKERDASVRGKMVVRFAVNPDGRVGRIALSAKTAHFKGTYVAGCIQKIIQRLKFPQHGGPAKTFPFPFTIK